MKNIFTLIILFVSISIFAQDAPQGFNYQGVARDSDNKPLTNQIVSLRISLINGNNNVSYIESHIVNTSDLGLFNLVIGQGNLINGDFETIDWGDSEYFIKIELDPLGGSNYINMGQSQLLSVPYALYAANGGGAGTPGPKGDKGDKGEQGPKGDAGTGVKIVGSVSSLSQLPNPYTGSIGDMYISQNDGHGHVWNGSSFDDVGAIKGPKGDQGEQGIQGIMGLKGEKGDKGNIGLSGTDGVNGIDGTNGIDGKNGIDGLSSIWNYDSSSNDQGTFTLNTTSFSAVNTATINNLDANNVNMASWLNSVKVSDEILIRSADGNSFGIFKINTISSTANTISFTLSSLSSNGDVASGPNSIVFAKRGPEGAGVKIVGTVSNFTFLEIPYSGEIGDLFITENDGHGHVWTGSEWNDVGQIKGDKGDTGAPGQDGQDGQDGQNGTPGQDGDTKWLENGSSIYYNNGAVGIGTNNPLEDFHVNDVDGSGFASVVTQNGSVTNAIESTSGEGQIGTVSNHDLNLVANGLTQLTIEPDGDIKSGVSTWNDNSFSTQPGFPLTVNGVVFPSGGVGSPVDFPFGVKVGFSNSAINGSVRLNGSNLEGYTGGQWKSLTESGIGGSGTNNFLAKFNASGELEDSEFFESSGLLGIGTTSPTKRFHVTSTGSTASYGMESTQSFARMTAGSSIFIGSESNHDVRLITNNGTKVTVKTSGEVGIGTTVPSTKLHVIGSIRASNDLISDDDVIAGSQLYIGGSSGISWSPSAGLTATFTSGNIHPSNDNTNRLGQSSNRWTEVWATDGTINTSDARLKEKIEPLASGLETVSKLNPVSFEWINKRIDSKEELGFLAQDLLKVIPESVVTHEVKEGLDGKESLVEVERLGVKYHVIIPVLTKAIQEQQTIIEEQQVQMDLMKFELEAIKKMLEN